MSIKANHHSYTVFEASLLQILIAQNNALWCIAQELKKMNNPPKEWSHIDRGVQ